MTTHNPTTQTTAPTTTPRTPQNIAHGPIPAVSDKKPEPEPATLADLEADLEASLGAFHNDVEAANQELLAYSKKANEKFREEISLAYAILAEGMKLRADAYRNYMKKLKILADQIEQIAVNLPTKDLDGESAQYFEKTIKDLISNARQGGNAFAPSSESSDGNS